MKSIRRKDWLISRMALLMALSFLCIQYIAGEFLTPLLLSALLCVLFNLYQLVPGMLIIISWFYLWTLVSMPANRNRYWTSFMLACLGIAVAFPAWLYSQEAPPSLGILVWYILPATVFTGSTLVFIRWFYFVEEGDNSEISIK